MEDLVLKKCLKCGALVEVLEDCTCENCGIKCCKQNMERIIPNSDGDMEKHMPTYIVSGNNIIVTVENHPKDEEHHIEFVSLYSKEIRGKKFFKPGEEINAIFPYIKGSKIYSYCNKHGLWTREVK